MYSWNVVTYKWEVNNWKIETISFVVKFRYIYLSVDGIPTREWISDCCLTPSEQLVSYIIERTSYI